MKLQEILRGLDLSEKKELYNLLKKDMGFTPEFDKIKKELNKDHKVLCPHCLSAEIFGHGSYKERKRYKCNQCKKTFNDYTGTAISGIKKVEKFQEFLELTVESITIRKASKRLGVNMKTIFDWRHKLLSSISTMNGSSFSGIVECDDKQLDINEKGKRNLNRDAYKRPSDRTTKRGVSNDKVSIMVASDRKGNSVMRVAKMGRIDTESIEKTIGDLISGQNVLCSDSHPSIISWASNRELEHHTFIASKQHVKNKCYHVQHVNSMDNLYERWIKPFYGVATKYLSQYLNWFVFLEKVKNSKNPIMDMARVMMSNTNAIKSFREIENTYLKLNVPHYLKT
jgi:transposase-like protein